MMYTRVCLSRYFSILMLSFLLASCNGDPIQTTLPLQAATNQAQQVDIYTEPAKVTQPKPSEGIEGIIQKFILPGYADVTPQLFEYNLISHSINSDTLHYEDPAYRIVLIHGDNQEDKENTLFRWQSFISFLTSNPDSSRQLDNPQVLLFRYPSRWSNIKLASVLLKQLIERRYGDRPVLLIGHSRGGILARTIRALHPNALPWMGVITINSPNHGSPLSIPTVMLSTFHTQELSEIKSVIYIKAMLQWNSYVSPDTGINISQLFSDGGYKFLSPGTRSLFYDSTTVQLDPPLVYFGMQCDNEMPSDTEPIKTDSICAYNFARALKLWEGHAKLDSPTIHHASFLSHKTQNVDEAQAFTNSLVSAINSFTVAPDPNFEHKGLVWLSTQFHQIPASTDTATNDFNINDGMVDLASQCDLTSGPSVFSKESTDVYTLDTQAIASRDKNPNQCVIHTNMDHADVVQSQDPLYWQSIGKSAYNLVYEFFKKYPKYATNRNSDVSKAID